MLCLCHVSRFVCMQKKQAYRNEGLSTFHDIPFYFPQTAPPLFHGFHAKRRYFFFAASMSLAACSSALRNAVLTSLTCCATSRSAVTACFDARSS